MDIKYSLRRKNSSAGAKIQRKNSAANGEVIAKKNKRCYFIVKTIPGGHND